MDTSNGNLWFRWLSVFALISLGVALIDGLDWAMRDRQPLLAFFGFWIAQASFLVMPGAILGGIVGLATNKSALGAKVMIAVNSAVTALLIIGLIIKAQ